MTELPRVLMTTPGLARVVATAAAGRFAPVGAGQPADWLEQGGGAGIRVAISSGIDSFGADMFERLPDLEEIVVFGAGQAGIDLAAAARRGVRINAAGATHAGDVAEHAVGLILAAWRRIVDGDRWIRHDRWRGGDRMAQTRHLAGTITGIVGLGHIGNEAARRLDALGCRVIWWGPRDKPDAAWPRASSLLELARRCDILLVAAFAHDTTRGLVSAGVIEALGPDGLLVNVSRGFVIDEPALIAALRDGRLGYAALDVFDEEPTAAETWRDVPNIVVTPHIAASTEEAYAALLARTVAEVGAALARETCRSVS